MSVRSRRPLVAGNWKMNGLRASAVELADIIEGARDLAATVDLMVCPPATLIVQFAAHTLSLRSPVLIGAAGLPRASRPAPSPATFRRKCSRTPVPPPSSSGIPSGGPITRKPTPMCARRSSAARRAGLLAIVCVGETRAEREAGSALAVVERPARRLAPRRRDAGDAGGRLRAGLGDRHRAHPDRR